MKPQKPILIKNSIILVPPMGKLCWEGYKTLIILDKKIEDIENKQIDLIDGKFKYAVMILEKPFEIDLENFPRLANQHLINAGERRNWFPNKSIFYGYKIKKLDRLPIPQKIKNGN